MTIAILSTVLVVVAISIGNIRRADLKKTSGIMAASMRYLSNLAVINRTTYRLVIDMDSDTFWGEELQGDNPCDRYVGGEDTQGDRTGVRRLSGDIQRGEKAQSKDEEENPNALGGNFGKRKDNLLATRKLPKGIKVTGVITAHHQGAQEEGQAAIYFFPGGYAEQAYVWLGLTKGDSDSDIQSEAVMTMELSALSASVTKHQDVKDERDFLRGLDE